MSAASASAKAGFKIALPVGWQMGYPGQVTYFQRSSGLAFIEADLSPFTYPRPVREADYLQAQAKANYEYPLYGLVAIKPTTFRGVRAAIWRYHWDDDGVRIAVLQVLFTLSTSAGRQSYDLTVSAPSAHFASVSAIFRRALLTFRPLP